MIEYLKNLFSKKPVPKHIRTGRWGEKLAASALKKEGYKIIGKRFRIGKKDEIDIVARNDDTLVFIEVKTRRNEDFGRPISAVDRDKRKNLSRAAIRYIEKRRRRPDYFRFDVIEVVGQKGDENPEIRHIENAFTLDSRYRQPY